MERLRIKNFLIIEDADFEVGRFNVIIGSQASGKSIIAKLLYLFRELTRITVPENSPKEEDAAQLLEDIFSKDSWKTQTFEIDYQLNNIRIELSNDNAELRSYFKREGDFSLYPVFIPAVRSSFSMIQNNIFTLLKNKVTVDFFIQEFGAVYEEAKEFYVNNRAFNEQIEKIITDILKGEYVYDAGQDWIKLGNQRIPLSYSSSGQQEALPMLILLYYSIFDNWLSIIIEEPEAHLFPISQKRIIELLAILYNKHNADFVLTTHSPYILTAINNAILAHDVIAEKGRDAVKDIFNPDFAIKYEDVKAYTVENGRLISIMNDELRLIGSSVIDSVSDEFEHAFNSLLEL